MIILLINLEECFLERVTLTDEEIKRLETLDDDYGDYYEIAQSVLEDRGYFTQDPNITWMIADDVPIFDCKESIPFFTIS